MICWTFKNREFMGFNITGPPFAAVRCQESLRWPGDGKRCLTNGFVVSRIFYLTSGSSGSSGFKVSLSCISFAERMGLAKTHWWKLLQASNEWIDTLKFVEDTRYGRDRPGDAMVRWCDGEMVRLCDGDPWFMRCSGQVGICWDVNPKGNS